MEKIGLKEFLLKVKKIDVKRGFCRFCKSDNPLKYVLFPFGALLIMRFTIYGTGYIVYALDEHSKQLFAPLFWLLYYIPHWIKTLFIPIYEYFNLYHDPVEFCDYCIGELVFYSYPFFIFPYFILYLLWDLKRGKVNFSIKAFETNILLKKGKKFIVSKFRFFILWLFNCLKQVVTIPLKKILLIFVVPFICSLLSGENKYRILNAPYEDYLTVIVNEGGYIMKELIEDNLVGMYRKALNDPNYKYNILEPSNKLKKRFGDLSKYITKEEWKSSKCFLPLSLSDINENHSNTKSLIEDRNNILQCIENIVFFHSPKNKNVYFNYALYIGIYEEWLDKLNGKIFKILEEMLKHPCDYVIKEKDRNRIFQCNTLLKDRKYKYFELYIYDTNARVVRSIKISRED